MGYWGFQLLPWIVSFNWKYFSDFNFTVSMCRFFLIYKIFRYLLINGNIKQFNYKDEDTIENLTKSFVEDRFKRAQIERKCLALISILIN